MELYKKHRPKSFKGLIGNKATIQSLISGIENKKLPHTLLFFGPPGCGKTTMARILQSALNCSDIDFKELNCSAKENRGIDSIQKIERNMYMAPTGGKVRIFLLDEAHRLTPEAQDASLKILEDTPRHVYFILCTTDPQKIKKTIRSRCTDFPVEALTEKEIVKVISRVLKRENTKLPLELIEKIAEVSEGGSRKALVLLDKILQLPKDLREDAIQAGVEDEEAIALARALYKGSPWKSVAKILKGLTIEAESVRYVVLGYMRSILLSGKADIRAAEIIAAFSDNFYDSKEAGLALACYDVVVGTE